ncbi:sulfatase-like hydrolase/transferase [Luteolibacter sp. GHJ8]|uniref:Sulfatase-like hydrolase/transferase n=1 Tax=Luteolibacter rhizosphaerae TaxID=2989719 RepID=A0ABT3G5C1_9BACT|nr:sulfatase-like hydrolase/transferase [Luteolibacter rhizosphaerae]MCW1914769.1 sulfatase-like hydrolase/transferase [Luteolibacter rhizosphaerae]
MKTSYALLGLLASLAIPAHAERKPNILVIVADDLGWGELTSQGIAKDIPTPNIDSISRNGIRFTNGYVSGPYCSPTRAGLLTGRYQQRFGHEFNPGPPTEANQAVGLSLQETTIGDRLKSAGYATGWFGKSHLGNAPEFHPQKRGFDEFYGFLGGAHSYVDPGQGVNAVLKGTEPVKDPGYLTEAFAREAASFIERKKDEQWFVYLPFNAVHAPLETLEKYESRFSSIQDTKRRKFAGLLSALDDSVGTVLNKVRELNLEEDTLIYFFSDNGGPTPSITSGNGPLKGYKSQTSEGGIRVPFSVQWKGTIPAGKTEDRPVIQLDVLPTSLAAAGVEADPAWKLDGVNLLPYLKGEKTEAPHDALYWRFGQQLAVRKGDWKLVKSVADGNARGGAGKASVEEAKLYNLKDDIGEKNDLAAANPDKVKELTELWNQWNSSLVDPKWHPNGPRRGNRNNNSGSEVTSNASRTGPWKSGDVLSSADSPDVAGKAFTVAAEIEAGDAPAGVVVEQGGAARGYALHVTEGKLAFSVRASGDLSTIASTEALTPGPHKLEAVVSAAGEVTLKVDGKTVGEGKLQGGVDRRPGEGLTVGHGGRTAVTGRDGNREFTGKVSQVTVNVL